MTIVIKINDGSSISVQLMEISTGAVLKILAIHCWQSLGYLKKKAAKKQNKQTKKAAQRAIEKWEEQMVRVLNCF